jgi:tetratricopeptide (TPR) repeat protein
MNSLKKFTILLFILTLFIGCRTGIPLKTHQGDLQEIESAFIGGKWDDVIILGKKYLEGEPDNAVVSFVLSMAYYMKGEYELQGQQRALALEDEKSIDTIVAWCENLAQQFPKNYNVYLLLGSAYRAKDEVDKAMESYKKAIEINPNFAEAYLGVGAVYFAIGQINEAIKSFKKAIEINPSHMAAYFNLAAIYKYNGQIDEAIASYEKTVEINPGFVSTYVCLGDLYLEKGDRAKAIKAYKKVIELDPESELAIYAKDAIEAAKKNSDKGTENIDSEKTP